MGEAHIGDQSRDVGEGDDITVVVPCHNEQDNVGPLVDALEESLGSAFKWRVLFVNDGSTDRTLEALKALRRENTHVGYISFLGNYGHQKALLAGLRHAKGRYVVTMDADMQHPPSAIPGFVEAQQGSGAQVVAGRRHGKQQGALKNLLSSGFYNWFARLTGIRLEPGVSDFRLYTRKAVEVLASIEERDPFFRGLIPFLRLRTEFVDYELCDRLHGVPSYTTLKSARMAGTALLRFTRLPIAIGIVLGVVGILLSVFEGAQYVYLKLFTDRLVPGQAEAMVFLSVVSSVMLFMLSLSLHLGLQVLDYLRHMPSYVIECADFGEGGNGVDRD